MNEEKLQILSSISDNENCLNAFVNTILLSTAKIDEDKSTILITCHDIILNKLERVLKKSIEGIVIERWENNLLISKKAKLVLETFTTNALDKLTELKTIYLVCGKFYYNQDETQNSNGYHFEINLKDEESANYIITLFDEFGFKLKLVKRKNSFLVYTKNSNQICDIFVKLGASYFALSIQNSLSIREIRNNTNRQNNCFESNLDKTLTASAEQIVAINYILEHYSLDYLSDNLKDVALARLVNPDVSLNELRTILNNTISRAGIKYRLDKIIEIYKNLKGEK